MRQGRPRQRAEMHPWNLNQIMLAEGGARNSRGFAPVVSPVSFAIKEPRNALTHSPQTQPAAMPVRDRPRFPHTFQLVRP